MTMRLLDLFCGAGGAAEGYRRLGFHVTGVDILPQARYAGHKFVCGDAIQYLRNHQHEFDAVHASPPCQRFSVAAARHKNSHTHPNYLTILRHLLRLPHVIENVVGCPLHHPILLCGSMFGLKVRRHRLFECSFEVPRPQCRHHLQPHIYTVYGKSGGRSTRDDKTCGSLRQWQRAMGIDWMTCKELSQSIPPVYTEYVGKFLLASL